MKTQRADTRILVVDDETKKFQEPCKWHLENNSFVHIPCYSDSGVIELILNDPPDLIILDWDLGERSAKTGSELFTEINEICNIPILKISNYSKPEICLEDNRLAVEGDWDYRHVDKGIGMDAIVRIIQARLYSGQWPASLLNPHTLGI